MTPGMEVAAAAALGTYALRKAQVRLRLSLAKHPSLRGHAKMGRRLAKWLPHYEYGEDEVLRADRAPDEVVQRRQEGLLRLEQRLLSRAPKTLAIGDALKSSVSDYAFTNEHRVPFQYQKHIACRLKVPVLMSESSGVQVRDLDGNWALDVSGSYGVNLFGVDFYRSCIDRGIDRVRDLGPVLGPYHPIIADNVQRLKEISGQDEVSFHMSGTEAVMQAVGLARYHSGRSHAVRFCGAYHGWWDGVQPGVGNPRAVHDVYTLRDMHPRSLKVLRTRDDIACVLVNPLQALHLNQNASADSTLIGGGRSASFDRAAYTAWLRELREVCTERSIALIMDEVFLGFHIARGGAQEYFGVRADLVTYGKTVGGGLPIGVVCGQSGWMKRSKDDRPADVLFARGTFNSHPYVMGAMNEFLRRLDEPEIQAIYASTYVGVDARGEGQSLWDRRAELLNERFRAAGVPPRIASMGSVWTVLYDTPCPYHWMFQYYLRAHGLSLSWVGTGRFILSLNYTDEDYQLLADRCVAAAIEMQRDGWWWNDGTVTERSIKRDLVTRMLKARFGIGRGGDRGRPAARGSRTRGPTAAGAGHTGRVFAGRFLHETKRMIRRFL